MTKLAKEIRECLLLCANESATAAKLGEYRVRAWMSDGTTVVVHVREPTKASRAARARRLRQTPPVKRT